jgi:hypothetical protein
MNALTGLAAIVLLVVILGALSVVLGLAVGGGKDRDR